MNVIFDNVKIYKVQDKLDVVIGETFFMEVLDDFPPEMEVAHTKDPVISIADDERTVTTTKLGSSTIKFMTGDTVHKNLEINVVEATQAIATTLNGTLGSPEPK